VQGFEGERLENQEVEGTRDDVGIGFVHGSTIPPLLLTVKM
jgi:hypothetical protein